MADWQTKSVMYNMRIFAPQVAPDGYHTHIWPLPEKGKEKEVHYKPIVLTLPELIPVLGA